MLAAVTELSAARASRPSPDPRANHLPWLEILAPRYTRFTRERLPLRSPGSVNVKEQPLSSYNQIKNSFPMLLFSYFDLSSDLPHHP